MIFILAVLTNSCVTEFNAELPDRDVQVLFVDGSIVENSDVTFNITKSFRLNSIRVPNESLIVNANVHIIGGNGYKSLPAINLGKGSYSISVGELDDNVEYGLQIEYNGDIYQSKLVKPLHTPEIDSISWIQPEEKGDVLFRISTHDDTGETEFFIWECIEDWEISAHYYTTIFFSAQDTNLYVVDPAPFYYCWMNSKPDKYVIGSTESLTESRIINKQIYSCLPSGSRFTLLYSITVNQKAISKNAFEYYQNKIVLNEEMGGMFTPQPSELNGNITCITDTSKKVMGYVESVKNITQKKIFISPWEITRPPVYDECITYSDGVIKTLFTRADDPAIDPYIAAYSSGYRPVSGETEDISTAIWSLNFCSSCIANGGTKIKPDFWPNDHE